MKLKILLLTVIPFVSIADCIDYSCVPATDSNGKLLENVVETHVSDTYDFHVTFQSSDNRELPSNTTITTTCSSTIRSDISKTYYIKSDDGSMLDIWVSEVQETRECHRTDLNTIYDTTTGQERPIAADDCSSEQYFNGFTCEFADCAPGQVPDDDYATTFSCHDVDDNISVPGDNNDTTNPVNNIDSDGDGYYDSVDAFPNDPNEGMDTDNDGIGNNADIDDDNDGYSDSVENSVGSNPLSSTNTPDNIENSSSDYSDILNQINDGISQSNEEINDALNQISSDINLSSQRNHEDLQQINQGIGESNQHLSNLNTQMQNMNDFMQSGMDNTEAGDSLTDATNQASSTVSSITGSLNQIISNYTGTVPLITGTGNHIFTANIMGGIIEFDLSMFEELKQYFDILWLLMLVYFNFKIYSIIIRDLLKKF